MKKYSFLIIAFLIFSFVSCLKEEGEGGTSTIMGKVYAYNYNQELTELRWEGYIPQEDVYIVYGNDTIYGDRFRTNYDGSYRFMYLRPGTYKIFTYSKSLANVNTSYPDLLTKVETIVNITFENQVVIVDDLVIIK